MIKVLFICLGNICRSPMAEFCMKDLLAQERLENQIFVTSAATSTEEIWNGIGNPVYPPAKKELARHGISCEGKRAVQMTRADYDRYDYLIGMDNGNIRGIQRIAGGDPEEKVYKMLEFAGDGWKQLENAPGEAQTAGGDSKYLKTAQTAERNRNAVPDVADPWYTGNFDATWRDVEAGCKGLLEFLKRRHSL